MIKWFWAYTRETFPTLLTTTVSETLWMVYQILEEPNMRLDTGDSNRTILICM